MQASCCSPVCRKYKKAPCVVFQAGAAAMAAAAGIRSYCSRGAAAAIVITFLATLAFPARAAFAPSPYIVDLTVETFNSSIASLGKSQPCLVEFYANWCPACRNFAPIYEKVSSC